MASGKLGGCPDLMVLAVRNGWKMANNGFRLVGDKSRCDVRATG